MRAAIAAPTACGSWVPMQLDQLTWFAQGGEDPVGRLQRDGRGERGRLLPGAGAVEADAALALQGHHALVERPQPDHLAVEPQEQLRRGARPGLLQQCLCALHRDGPLAGAEPTRSRPPCPRARRLLFSMRRRMTAALREKGDSNMKLQIAGSLVLCVALAALG